MKAHFSGSNEHMETSSGTITVDLARRGDFHLACGVTMAGVCVASQGPGDVIMSDGMSMNMLEKRCGPPKQ